MPTVWEAPAEGITSTNTAEAYDSSDGGWKEVNAETKRQEKRERRLKQKQEQARQARAQEEAELRKRKQKENPLSDPSLPASVRFEALSQKTSGKLGNNLFSLGFDKSTRSDASTSSKSRKKKGNNSASLTASSSVGKRLKQNKKTAGIVIEQLSPKSIETLLSSVGEWYQNDEYAQCKAVAAHFEGAMGMMQEMKYQLSFPAKAINSRAAASVASWLMELSVCNPTATREKRATSGNGHRTVLQILLRSCSTRIVNDTTAKDLKTLKYTSCVGGKGEESIEIISKADIPLFIWTFGQMLAFDALGAAACWGNFLAPVLLWERCPPSSATAVREFGAAIAAISSGSRDSQSKEVCVSRKHMFGALCDVLLQWVSTLRETAKPRRRLEGEDIFMNIMNLLTKTDGAHVAFERLFMAIDSESSDSCVNGKLFPLLVECVCHDDDSFGVWEYLHPVQLARSSLLLSVIAAADSPFLRRIRNDRSVTIALEAHVMKLVDINTAIATGEYKYNKKKHLKPSDDQLKRCQVACTTLAGRIRSGRTAFLPRLLILIVFAAMMYAYTTCFGGKQCGHHLCHHLRHC